MSQSQVSENRQVVLETKNLTIRFGGLTAVNGLDLAIHKNQIFGLIGPNGAGKTTVFNLITQHYEPTDGEIYFQGKVLEKTRPNFIAQIGIARTFQNIRLFTNLSVRENVMLGMHMRLDVNWWKSMVGLMGYGKKEKAMYKKADALLKRVGLFKYTDYQAGSLPYGLQRRLEIARALATEPILLLPDEPAAGMNPQEVVDLTKFIRDIRDEFDITILLIEHHMSLVMNLCDEMAVMDYGKKIAQGDARHVKDNPKVIEAYLGVDKHA